MNTAASALVVLFSGFSLPSLPTIKPSFTKVAMLAAAYSDMRCVSLYLARSDALPCVFRMFSMFSALSVSTIMSCLVMFASGANWLLPMPLVMPSFLAMPISL
jgi:hypothetical protein